MDEYQALLERYLKDLRLARDAALAWWDDLLVRELAIVGNRAEAMFRIQMRWPCGPASHPRVIAVFRQYYLECEAIEVVPVQVVTDPHDESAWGVEDEAVDNDGGVSYEPCQLLLESLVGIDGALHKFMKTLDRKSVV